MEKEIQKNRCIRGIGIDIIIIFFGILGSYIEIYENGLIMLTYYTVESNLFISLGCMLDLIYQIRELQGKRNYTWIKNIKYFGTCCMTITFMVVFFILAPSGGIPEYIRMFFEGPLKYQHTLCPILAVMSFFMVDTYQHDLKKNMAAISLTPTIIYAIISTSLNIAKVMHGPYSFLYVYEQPIWMSVMYVFLIMGIAYLIGWGLWKISRVIKEKRMECYA
ncbi:MAG: hypothetical protein IJA36_03320 [Lachnospiraceae bacterium]|nr:hypothetical protein [Lachnospiraceae bacterium]